jgi:hypothetical protein
VRFHLGRFGAVLIAATIASSAGLASAKPTDSHDSAYSKFESLASRLKADGERMLAAAGDATARAVDASKGAIAGAQDDLAPRLETFRQMLNEQKAKLAMIGEDAAARFDAWKQAATKSWSDAWTESWSQSWAEIQRAATETLDRFRDWIAKTPDGEEHTEIPV